MKMIEFLQSNSYLIISFVLNIIFFILFIIGFIKIINIKKEYNIFMKKLGKGKNMEEILNRHFDKVQFVQKQNEEILDYCRKIDTNFAKTISKVGIVRYSAFRDTGSDLSFTLALLNKNNDGVVLNGIYSREMSNIYAKPIQNAESTYTLSNEEKEAIKKAINNNI